MSQPSEAIWLIKQLDSTPWLRIVYDYSHLIYRDISLTESLREALPYLACRGEGCCYEQARGQLSAAW